MDLDPETNPALICTFEWGRAIGISAYYTALLYKVVDMDPETDPALICTFEWGRASSISE